MNVLFISADQWRAECLGCAGHPQLRTPHLDQLAAEGVRFAQHFTQAAPCGPARASLLTGLYAMNHRSILNGTPLDARHTNLALEARRVGYDPILFGYTDTSPDPRQHAPKDPALRDFGGVLPGFRPGLRYEYEVCVSWTEYLRQQGYPVRGLGREAMYADPESPLPAGRGHSLRTPMYCAADSDTAFTADQVIHYLHSRETSGWFVHAVFLRPHPPFYAPAPYHDLYDPERVAEPVRHADLAREWAQHPFLAYWSQLQRRPGYLAGHPLDVVQLPEHEIRQMRASYYGLITEVDHHIGRIITTLKALGEYENTLIVFTVDHGEQLGDHGLWGKGGYFDASYHIPLIIRVPQVLSSRVSPTSGLSTQQQQGPGAGWVVDALTEAVDVMPTILEAIGAPVPAHLDGRSLWPWLRQPPTADNPVAWRQAVHWEYDFRDPVAQQAERYLGLDSVACHLNVLRTARHKLVHFAGLPPVLFDLDLDPHEFENRAADPAYREVLLALTQHLLSLRMRHADQTLTHTQITERGLFGGD